MREATQIEKDVRALLEHEPRVNLHRSPLEVHVENGKVILTGQVADIAEKRIAVERVRHAPGVDAVEDDIRVEPSETLGDGAIRDAVSRQLLDEPVFSRTSISCRIAGDEDVVARSPDGSEGKIDVSIANGAVKLSGQVMSLSHRRLAGALTWWARGCRNVINELDIQPPERDDDGEIADAIDLILNKDPLVHLGQTEVRVRNGRVTLRGVVATEEEKQMIERDIWYIDGVHDVINQLEVYHAPTGKDRIKAHRPALD